MKNTHLILTGFSLTILLLSLNRLTNLTQSYIYPFEFLRWLDFNAMIPIPLLSIVLYYLLKREITKDSNFVKSSLYTGLSIALIAGIYLFGAGSGDHELTNYLNSRFCQEAISHYQMCQIINFNDDEFSHLIYYLGFILMNLSLILIEFKSPRKKLATMKDLMLISLNAIFIGMGIFANLAFEPTGLDLAFFSTVLITCLAILILGKGSIRRLPVIFYFTISYLLGVGGTILYKFISS